MRKSSQQCRREQRFGRKCADELRKLCSATTLRDRHGLLEWDDNAVCLSTKGERNKAPSVIRCKGTDKNTDNVKIQLDSPTCLRTFSIPNVTYDILRPWPRITRASVVPFKTQQCICSGLWGKLIFECIKGLYFSEVNQGELILVAFVFLVNNSIQKLHCAFSLQTVTIVVRGNQDKQNVVAVH